jgi:hypothetical protein
MSEEEKGRSWDEKAVKRRLFCREVRLVVGKINEGARAQEFNHPRERDGITQVIWLLKDFRVRRELSIFGGSNRCTGIIVISKDIKVVPSIKDPIMI